MKPKKLNLEQQKVKLIALKSKAGPQKQFLENGELESVGNSNKTPNEKKIYQAT